MQFFNVHIMTVDYAKFQKSLIVEQFQGNYLNPKKSRTHFQNPSAKLSNTTKNTNFPGIQPCVCTLIDHGQRPITARVALTTLYNLLLIIKLSHSACEK